METFDSDLQGALREYRRAAILAPKDVAVIRRLAMSQALLGELEVAEAGARQAVALDPLNVGAYSEQGRILASVGRIVEAETALRKVLDLQPKHATTRAILAQTIAQQGRGKEAVQLAEQEPDPFWRIWGLALVHELNGERTESQTYLDQMIKENAGDAAVQIAQVYAARKEPEEMFRWLAHAKKTRDPGMVELQAAPYLIDYKSDPRYQALLREYRLFPEDAPADTAIPVIRN